MRGEVEGWRVGNLSLRAPPVQFFLTQVGRNQEQEEVAGLTGVTKKA